MFDSEDYLHAESLKTEEEKNEFYIDVKSAAESGWDFSSRWFISNGTNGGKLSNFQKGQPCVLINNDITKYLILSSVPYYH